MVPLIQFVFFILNGLISLIILVIFISVILSWLISFQIINTRNPFIYQVWRFLEAVTEPILRPFRRIIPPLGGADISPILAWLVLVGIQRYLLPALANYLIGIASPTI